MHVKTLMTRKMSKKSGPSEAQMEKKRSGRGKRSGSPQLPPPKYGKMDQMALLNQACTWKKLKLKHKGIQALVDAGLLQEKARVRWNTATGDPWPIEKNSDEIPMFTLFVERRLTLSASDFFRGCLEFFQIEYVHLNPNGIFHIAIFVHYCKAFLGIRPHWGLFWKIFRLKQHTKREHTEVVSGAGV